MRYVNTKPNSKELKPCILKGPYVMTKITVPTKPATETKAAVPTHNVHETYKNTSTENHAYYDAEAKAIHMILSGIRDDIYSTVYACITAKEMWVAIERLHQVNEIRAEKIARNANPLAQHCLEYHHQEPKPNKPIAQSSRHIPSSKSLATTRNKGKEVVKPITPPSESAYEEDSDEE
ncbi:hypothetical protein Tco_1356220 [Tanacetum coccineum]